VAVKGNVILLPSFLYPLIDDETYNELLVDWKEEDTNGALDGVELGADGGNPEVSIRTLRGFEHRDLAPPNETSTELPKSADGTYH
jgi:hypothetical protein